jgi:hypothetical protein
MANSQPETRRRTISLPVVNLGHDTDLTLHSNSSIRIDLAVLLHVTDCSSSISRDYLRGLNCFGYKGMPVRIENRVASSARFRNCPWSTKEKVSRSLVNY